MQGETDKAIPLLERALRICQSADIPVYVPFVSSRLGAAHLFAGRVFEACPIWSKESKISSVGG